MDTHMPFKCTIKQVNTERPKSMTVHDMYTVANKLDTQFGIEGYDIKKKYLDPQKMKEDEFYAKCRKDNKWPKQTKKELKKGSYLEQIQNDQKGKPGPGTYKIKQEWVSKRDIEKGKNLPKNTTKNTYIDTIVKSNKKNNFPGIGKYNIAKTQEQIKKDIELMKQKQRGKGADRQTTTEEIQFIAAQGPGVGQYNPHNPNKEELHPEKFYNRTKPEDWRKKHQEKEKQRKRAVTQGASVGTYKPQPVTFMTFDKLSEKFKNKQSTNVKYFGKEERFKGLDKKIKQNIGPGSYDLNAKWLGKEDGMKGNKKASANWMNRISRGISKSIYY